MSSYFIFENGLPAGKYKLDVEYGEFLFHIWEWPFDRKVQTRCGIWWFLRTHLKMIVWQASTDWMWNTVSSYITFENDLLAGKYRLDVEYDEFLYHIWEWSNSRKIQAGCGIPWVLILYLWMAFGQESTDWIWNMVSSYFIFENGLPAGKYKLDVEDREFLYYIWEWPFVKKVQTGCGIRWILIIYLRMAFRQECADWMWNTVSSYIIFENSLPARKYRLDVEYGEFLYYIWEWPFGRNVQTGCGIRWVLILYLRIVFRQESTDWMWKIVSSYIIFENGLSSRKYRLDVEYGEFL